MTTHSGGTGHSWTTKASKFKVKCPGLKDKVAENGKPVAKLTAFHEQPQSLFGIDKRRLKITVVAMSTISFLVMAMLREKGTHRTPR